MACQGCGAPEIPTALPRFVEYSGGIELKEWPTDASGNPLPEALGLRCEVCGFMRYRATVRHGGEPWTPPAPLKPAGVVNDD